MKQRFARKKIMVFGANSLMALSLMQELAKQNSKVYAVDICEARKIDGVEYFKLDITDGDFSNLPAEIDLVLNFAAFQGEDYSACARVNVLGAINILNYCRHSKTKRFIHSSSSAVYGIPEYIPMGEDHPKKPVTNYGMSKLISEWIIDSFARNYGFSYVIFRYASPFGADQKPNSVLPIFIQKVINGDDLTVYQMGKRKQEFICVKDIVQACLLAMDSRKSGCFNIGSEIVVSMRELAEAIIKVFSDKKNIRILNFDADDEAPFMRLDSNKAWKDLKFRAKYDLESALKDYKKEMLTIRVG